MKITLAILTFALAYTSIHASAGVLHPCPDSAFKKQSYPSAQITSVDGRLAASIRFVKVINLSCPQVTNDYFNFTTNVVDSETGRSIFPNHIEVVATVLDSGGNVIDRHESQAPMTTEVRLRDGAATVHIWIDGFKEFEVEL